jgi:hypothetical protein
MLDALAIYYFIANLRNAGYFELAAAHAVAAKTYCLRLWSGFAQTRRGVAWVPGGAVATRRFAPVRSGPAVALAPSIEQTMLEELQDALGRLENYLASMA